MGSNSQSNQKKELENTATKSNERNTDTTKLSREDRAAINCGLSDQAQMFLLTEAGRSSQDKRLELKRKDHPSSGK